MSNDDPIIIPKQGWLKIKLHSQTKWHRRYCMIDWDKAMLFIASKIDKNYRDWIKLLPNIFINDNQFIEIKVDNQTHLLQPESKTEYDSWLLALKKIAYSRIGGGIFGQSLDDTYKYARDKTSPVPLIVRQCCEYLLEYGSTFVGLFRIPGKLSSIKELRDMYDRGLAIEFNASFSPATISSLLKIYLQSLPEPIIPIKNFYEFLEIGSRFKYNHTNDINHLKQFIEKTLPNINYALLAYLCLFLKKLTEHVQETKMDTDNLAVTFGNNLIRPTEELDLNMIKGHNYNLLPLIKSFIDHSEYLFLNNSNESCEQNNESITKSSGFSSVSSLLSSNEQPITLHTRSSSMPSIRCTIHSSIDSANLSYEDLSDNNNVQYRSKRGLVKQRNSQQSFTTCFEREFSMNQENQLDIVEKRCHNIDAIKDEERIKEQAVILKQKYKSDIPFQFTSENYKPSALRKSSKKTFANKFGKSLSSFKSSMSKALHSNFSSTENVPHGNSTLQQTSDSDLLIDYLKSLQNEIHLLKQSLDTKENLLVNLQKTSYAERLRYEQENIKLKEKIQQLENENFQLKARYQSDN